MNPKVVSEEPVSVYDLRKYLKEIKKRDSELSLRSGKTEEYVNNFAVLKEKDAEELEKEILKLEIPRMKENIVKKILDVLPASVEELKVVLSQYSITITKENYEKIIEAINKYKKA
ncbi:MAG: hypothetical protein QXM96_00655 [Candidatus Woesearchaeota archaeon]